MIAAVKRPSQSWEQILAACITDADGLCSHYPVDRAELERVTLRYPMAVNPYYLGLIRNPGDAIYRQAVPDVREVEDQRGYEDPLNEEDLSPVPGLTHKYPDRVLFLISNRCAMICRFCNRKRKVGRHSMVTEESVREGICYISNTPSVRDVLLSGGDPLLLSDKTLFRILSEIRSIPHVEIIRIGTRIPCTLPQRVTPQLVEILKGFHPLYINTHFNHPAEITPEAALACGRLADAGIPIGCQTVLLRGVNDEPAIIRELMQRLLLIRVRPYYLFQPDLARGTAHFWTPLEKGMKIMMQLQGHTSGLCVPHFAVDLPGGGGKVPVLPENVRSAGRGRYMLRNYQGEEHLYPPADV